MFGLGNLNLIIKSKIPKMAPPLKWAPYLTKYPSNWPKFKIGVQHFLKRSLSFLHGQVMKQQALVLLISLLPIFSKLLLLHHYNTTYWLTFKLNVTMSKSVFRSKLKMLILNIYNSFCIFLLQPLSSEGSGFETSEKPEGTYESCISYLSWCSRLFHNLKVF